MTNDNRPIQVLKTRYKLFYILSVVALAVLFCANFSVIYTLILTPPEDPGLTMKFVYLIMVGGFLVIAAQTLLVFTRFISMLGRESKAMEDMNRQLDELSVYDELTKVFNRYKFESVISRELENVRRYSSPLSGIMLDIDGFKAVNEAHGYRTGDRLLANLAGFIDSKLRTTDYVFRWRGGKFIILAPHTDIDKAAMVAENSARLSDTSFSAENPHHPVAGSDSGCRRRLHGNLSPPHSVRPDRSQEQGQGLRDRHQKLIIVNPAL